MKVRDLNLIYLIASSSTRTIEALKPCGTISLARHSLGLAAIQCKQMPHVLIYFCTLAVLFVSCNDMVEPLALPTQGVVAVIGMLPTPRMNIFEHKTSEHCLAPPGPRQFFFPSPWDKAHICSECVVCLPFFVQRGECSELCRRFGTTSYIPQQARLQCRAADVHAASKHVPAASIYASCYGPEHSCSIHDLCSQCTP